MAVNYGAKDGQSFAKYVDYLVDNGYVPANSRNWVDDIRQEGNHATHNQEAETEGNAKTILDFVQMLLMINFQFNDAYKSKK